MKASTPNQLYRSGWRKEDLKIGDAVTVTNSSPPETGCQKRTNDTIRYTLKLAEAAIEGQAVEGTATIR